VLSALVDSTTIVLVIGSAAILVFPWIVGELLIRGIRIAARIGLLNPGLTRNINRGIRVLALSIGLFGVASYTGLASQFAVLTVTGLAGLAITLSLQSMFQNILSGIFLIMDKTVRVNDVIKIGDIKGRVVRVGLRNTLIRTDDGNIAIIGNSNLMSGPFVNFTASQRFPD
jgi:small-conductance mechanosensitive channel